MANGVQSTPGLSFPRETFAKLTPRPFLLAHLKQEPPIRPNGRTPHEFRTPTINTGSLTHSNGSAVVRLGDTAVVCGVRGEILRASDIPHPPSEDADEMDLVKDLGLVVPNVELSTGCSPAHLPGNPPTSHAQSLSYRIASLIHDSRLINGADLKITYTEPKTDNDLPDAEPVVTTKAYWTLYVDILCLALDGNAFDAAWLAVVAALANTTLPRAWWDPDRESDLCSPLVSGSHPLSLSGLPLASSFTVFTTSSHLKQPSEAESWVIADPDAFEEDAGDGTLTIALSLAETGGKTILKVEKHGCSQVGKSEMRRCIHEAERHWDQIQAALAKG